MNSLLKKLNLKNQKSVLVLNAPADLNDVFTEFSEYIEVITSVEIHETEFALVFCTKLDEIQKFAPLVDKIMANEGLFWFAYPKGSSKKYKCEFNRDNGWQVMGDLGYEPVRMVAFDEDWSALRFKKAENIKKMVRDTKWRMSKEGKKKN
ncbi:MAG: hypothetical protein LCH67_18300 [Bacteroidetes bacterium]|nr:hypothetical protein [Bacteroidota bacterium]